MLSNVKEKELCGMLCLNSKCTAYTTFAFSLSVLVKFDNVWASFHVCGNLFFYIRKHGLLDFILKCRRCMLPGM